MHINRRSFLIGTAAATAGLAPCAAGSAPAVADDPITGADQTMRNSPSWHLSHGDLKVSDNGRFLVHSDGTPFFYLSDTNWEFFHRARREDAERLLDTRRRQGFTVICGVLTGILDQFDYDSSFAEPNPYGQLPFIDKDVTRPATTPGSDPNDPKQYDYWDHVDYLVSVAEKNGLYVGLIPAWRFHYRAGLVNKTNARAYGRFLGQRFGARRNIIWVLGGDTHVDSHERFLGVLPAQAKWALRRIIKGVYPVEPDLFREMAAGIKEGESRPHLMTFHPDGWSSSSEWFHNDDWLDFNMLQSGHGGRDVPNYKLIKADYARIPPKPAMDGENRYEDHSVGYDPKNGWFNDYDNRQAAYWALFAGAHGHTYGNRGVWQMYEPGRKPSGPLRYYWYDAMELPGAWDMGHVRNLMLSRPMLSRVPDQSIVADVYSGADHIQATRGDGYAFIYAATGKAIKAVLGTISGDRLVAWWYDPRSGTATRIGEFANEGVQLFEPPGTPGRGNDWVLALDDKLKGFGPPGTVPSDPSAD